MEAKKPAGWIVLGAIVAVAAVALAVTNGVTQEPIAQQSRQQADAALTAMFPETADAGAVFEALSVQSDMGLTKAYVVKRGDEVIGYAASRKTQGYGGPIEVTVGTEATGVIRGVAVGGEEFKETEGLGSRVREPAFTDQFKGKAAPVTLGQEVDGVSGATVSSKAVVEGVNGAVEKLKLLAPMGSGQAPAGTESEQTASASVMGYKGPVLATITLDGAGAISHVEIGQARFEETEGVGSKVKDAAFTQQFIGKTPPLTDKDIDLIAGATVSSKAALDAVNAAHAYLTAK